MWLTVFNGAEGTTLLLVTKHIITLAKICNKRRRKWLGKGSKVTKRCFESAKLSAELCVGFTDGYS